MKPWEALKAMEEGQEVECQIPTSMNPVWTRFPHHSSILVQELFRLQYRLKPREPQVLEFELDCRKENPVSAIEDYGNGPSQKQWETLCGKRWRIVATEVVE